MKILFSNTMTYTELALCRIALASHSDPYVSLVWWGGGFHLGLGMGRIFINFLVIMQFHFRNA